MLQHGWTLKTLCKGNKPDVKDIYCMIPHIGNTQKRQIIYTVLFIKTGSISWLPEADTGLKNNYKCTQENFFEWLEILKTGLW